MATKITLAGEEVEIHELPFIPNRQWCDRAMPILTAEEALTQQVKAGASVAEAYNGFINLQIEHAQTMFDLVLDYLPDQSKREHYANAAKPSEIFPAFFTLAGVAFNNGFFLTTYGAAWIAGEQQPATGTNSVEASGDSGHTN